MRILFTSFPAYGHLHPLMPLALAARDAGHDVRIATGPNLVEWIASCGISAAAVGPSADVAAQIAQCDFSGPTRTGRMFTDVWVPAALLDLRELTSSWRPDLIIHEEEEYAGVALAAMLDVACVTHSWPSPARPAHGRRLASELLDGVWERLRLGSTSRRVGAHYLDACPPEFQTSDLADLALTSKVFAVRPVLFDGPMTASPAWVDKLPRPAAYLTLGTVPVFSQPEILRGVANALAPLFEAVLVTSGPNPVDSLGVLPDNVMVTSYLPQSLVLPTVDLVVSHAGAGGTLGALMYGLPHLALPGAGQSQIAIADALQRIGAGLRLGDEERDLTHIQVAASRLISEPRFAAEAARVRDQLRSLPAPADVMAFLESEFG